MAKTCSANYVDRLLMKINGAICPIWNSLFYTVEEVPCSESFFSCVNALINEAPRLKSIWSKAGKGWQVIEPDSQKITDTYRFDAIAVEKRERIQTLIQAPIDLEHSLPLRITIGKIVNNEGFSWIIAFQMHHAAGDGQSLIHFVARFWDLLNCKLNQHSPSRKKLAPPQMTDKKFIQYCLKNKKVLPNLFKAKYRQLSRRASPLSHHGTQIGVPYLHSIQFSLSHLKNYNSSELFYSAILAAIYRTESIKENRLIRFRIPVDLRSIWMVPKNSIENGCAAIMIELPLQVIKQIHQNRPKHLGLLIRKTLTQLLLKRIYLCNALECILMSHLCSEKKLKSAAREELLADKRSSTLVITHFGDVTSYLKPPCPIKVINLEAHTPVWGSNSFVYEETLYINNTCFDKIWSHEQMQHFCFEASSWLQSQYGPSGISS
ncbi:hypothetical protein [Legionella sainthelensi]|uniref:hypothetical protein n=2 Tax=Legionella sainthelensi TaxID=28087 RepID=UPI000E20C60D|nr:hypothetical protein [Legionella sainthelensi]